MDDVDLAWGNILDWSKFSIRVAESDLPRLYDILKAVPHHTIVSMQERLHQIWTRFAYVRYRRDMSSRFERMGYNVHAMLHETVPMNHNVGDDAFDTFIQALFHKLRKRGARPSQPE